MTKMSYSFCVLRYAHDPIAGECLNIGVLLVSPLAGFLGVRLEYDCERLSATFAMFDAVRFKEVLQHFEASVERERIAMFEPKVLIVADRPPVTADRIAARIWSDPGLSFRAGEPMAGLADDLSETLASLFERFVSSQRPSRPAPSAPIATPTGIGGTAPV